MIPILSRTGVSAGHREDRPDEQERQHRAEHEHVAMGEVDELDDAVDERVAEGHEGEDQAVREADDLRLEERFRSEDEDAHHLEDKEREDRSKCRSRCHGSVSASRWR